MAYLTAKFYCYIFLIITFFYLTFIGPCIAICISIVKPTRFTNVSNVFYFGMTLYMFRMVFPFIIRSSILYIQQQAFVKQILLSACHHQEFKTVHTATGICQRDTAVCLPSSGVQDCTYSNRHLSKRYCCLLAIIRSSRLYIQQQAFVKEILLPACKQTTVSV